MKQLIFDNNHIYTKTGILEQDITEDILKLIKTEENKDTVIDVTHLFGNIKEGVIKHNESITIFKMEGGYFNLKLPYRDDYEGEIYNIALKTYVPDLLIYRINRTYFITSADTFVTYPFSNVWRNEIELTLSDKRYQFSRICLGSTCQGLDFIKNPKNFILTWLTNDSNLDLSNHTKVERELKKTFVQKYKDIEIELSEMNPKLHGKMKLSDLLLKTNEVYKAFHSAFPMLEKNHMKISMNKNLIEVSALSTLKNKNIVKSYYKLMK